MYELDELALIEADINKAQSALEMAKVRMNLLKEMIAKGQADKPAQVEPVKAPIKIEIVKVPEPAKVEEPLIVNDEWKAALALLNQGREHVFVTGGAGTGKSTMLSHFVERQYNNYAIVAPTGVAAIRVGGETIHRFFAFEIGKLGKEDIKYVSESRRPKYEALDLLVIDEISMVRADLMDAIDLFLRKNGREKGKPFGGCRLIMFGDPFQLPPVAKDKDERKWLTQRYGTPEPYFFHAECWRETPPKIVNLTTIFRQKDAAFTNTLNAVRSGIITAENMALINSRVMTHFHPPADQLWITLTTTNDAAKSANLRMLNQINSPEQTFQALVSGEFKLENAPTDELLRLKVGAAVMFIRNDPDGTWANGTLGKVTKLKPLTVLVNGAEQEVDPVTWTNIGYEFDEEAKKLTRIERGEFTQVPLKLAAAVTIHKSQGTTLDRCVIDLSGGAFAAGQAYVALSRCRTLEGMVLKRALRESDLIVSSEVQAFMSGKPIVRPLVAVGQLL